MRPPENIATPRILLRKPRLDDALSIFNEYARDKEVTRFLRWRPHERIETTRAFLRQSIANWDGDHEFTWLIVSRNRNELMGSFALVHEETGASLGFVLAKRFWSHGYISEAINAVSEWALAQDGISRVWAVCDIENTASSRVLEKSGMQREGILRRWIVLPNMSSEPRDCYSYSRVK